MNKVIYNPYASALDGLELKNPVLAFFDFCKERESIRKKRDSGESFPWSNDPIFQNGRFLNVFREDDRVSKAIIKFAENYKDQLPILVQALFFARWCNREEVINGLSIDILTNKILMKDSKDMMIAFLKLIFKVDLQPILDESGQFDFYLLTGIGQRKGDSIGVEPAEVKDLPTTIEALSKIFKEDKINLGKTVDSKGNIRRQPWEYEKEDRAPAKLFYTIYNGKTPLLNLEIRYKGSKTAEPQFQATATPMFKNIMSGKS